MSDCMCESWTNGGGHYDKMKRCKHKATYTALANGRKVNVCTTHAKVMERKYKNAEFFLLEAPK